MEGWVGLSLIGVCCLEGKGLGRGRYLQNSDRVRRVGNFVDNKPTSVN